MPFTPFHFGPAFFIGILFVNQVNMASILLTSVLVDIEPIYCLASDSCPLHGVFHTYIGATALSAISIPLVYFGKKPLQKLSDHLGVRQGYSIKTIALGAMLGGWSHVFLDSFLYSELMPFWPLMNNNPFTGLLSNATIIVITVVGFVAGAALYFWKLKNLLKAEKTGSQS